MFANFSMLIVFYTLPFLTYFSGSFFDQVSQKSFHQQVLHTRYGGSPGKHVQFLQTNRLKISLFAK